MRARSKGAGIHGALLPLVLLASCASPGYEVRRVAPPPAPVVRTTYIDTHNHLMMQSNRRSRMGGSDYGAAARSALAAMDQLGIERMLILPPPFPPGHPGNYDVDDFRRSIEQYSDRVGFLGGGGSLNPQIQQAKSATRLTDRVKKRFEETAVGILSKGAVGFGELAVEHFSLNRDHPYQSVRADHPLFLLLADIAAKRDVPMDIHMEAIPEDMPLPNSPILVRSGRNPKTLRENISAFERLLDHNPKAKIIWAHAGWCNTGRRTPELCRALLSKHLNLFMSFKLSPDSMEETRPLDRDGQSIRPEWLQLIRDYPDRFIVGTDQFYVPEGSRPVGPQKSEAMELFVKLLPPDLARQVGSDNPKRLFNLR